MHDTPHYLETASLKMLHNVIKEHLKNQRPPLVVLGDTGSGKSTLLYRLVNDLDACFDSCLYTTHRRPTIKSSLHAAIGKQWVKESSGNINTRTIFNALCEADPRHPPLLLIDDAHLLSKAELNGIINLKYATDARGKTRFGLILCGRPNLEPRVAELTPENMSHHIRLNLRPFTRIESEAFTRSLGHTLTNRQMTRLYRNSNGLPGSLVTQLEKTNTSRRQSIIPSWFRST